MDSVYVAVSGLGHLVGSFGFENKTAGYSPGKYIAATTLPRTVLAFGLTTVKGTKTHGRFSGHSSGEAGQRYENG